MSRKQIIWLVVIVALVLIFFGIILYARTSGKTVSTTVGPNQQQSPGLLGPIVGWINSVNWGSIFGGGGIQGGNGQTTSDSGYTLVGNCVNGCDDGNPGTNCYGFLDTNCGG